MLPQMLLILVWVIGFGIFGPANGGVSEPAVTEVQIQNHRCLLVTPSNLSAEAPVVFILHGLGANAEDLFPLIEAMNLPPCRYILPDAPIPISDHAFAWYNQQTNSREDVVKSRDYLFGLMNRFSTEGEKQGHARPVILLGFSQGGVMALEAGLNDKGKVAAIVSMSGYIWNPGKTLAHPLAPLNTPILMVHGTEDVIVQEDLTQKTVTALKQAGYKPIFKEFEMGHQISKDSLAEVTQYLQKILIPLSSNPAPSSIM